MTVTVVEDDLKLKLLAREVAAMRFALEPEAALSDRQTASAAWRRTRALAALWLPSRQPFGTSCGGGRPGVRLRSLAPCSRVRAWASSPPGCAQRASGWWAATFRERT